MFNHDRGRVAALLGLLILRRPIINILSMQQCAILYMGVRMTHALQHGAAWREQARMRAGCVNGQLDSIVQLMHAVICMVWRPIDDCLSE